MSEPAAPSPPTEPPRALQKPRQVEEDKSMSVDLELGTIKSLTGLSEASTAIHAFELRPVADTLDDVRPSPPYGSPPPAQDSLPREKKTLKHFIWDLKDSKKGFILSLVLIYAPSIVVIIWPFLRLPMGMSLLEMSIFVMMGFTVNMVWLFCSVMFSKGMLHWDDPSKLLVTITVLQYCGLVMGILYGAVWYWACSDMHHTTRGFLSIRPA